MDIFYDFLKNIDNLDQRHKLEEVFLWIKTQFPTLIPEIKWNQPMFTEHGTFILGFSVSKKHIAVAPERETIQNFSKDIELAGYDFTKELIRIPWDKTINYSLIKKMILFNIKEKASITSFWRQR